MNTSSFLDPKAKKLRKTRASSPGTRQTLQAILESNHNPHGGRQQPMAHAASPSLHATGHDQDPYHTPAVHGRAGNTMTPLANGGSPGNRAVRSATPRDAGRTASATKRAPNNQINNKVNNMAYSAALEDEARATLAYVTRLESEMDRIEAEHQGVHEAMLEAIAAKNIFEVQLAEQEARSFGIEAEADARTAMLQAFHRAALRIQRDTDRLRPQPVVSTTAQAYVVNDLREMITEADTLHRNGQRDVQRALVAVEAQLKQLESGMASRAAADAKLYSVEVAQLGTRMEDLTIAVASTANLKTKRKSLAGADGSFVVKGQSMKASAKRASVMQPPSDDDEEDSDNANAEAHDGDRSGGGTLSTDIVAHELRSFKADIASLIGRVEGSLSGQVGQLKRDMLNEMSFASGPNAEAAARASAATESKAKVATADAVEEVRTKLSAEVQKEHARLLEALESWVESKESKRIEDIKEATLAVLEAQATAEKAEREGPDPAEVASVAVTDLRREAMEWRRTVHAALLPIQESTEALQSVSSTSQDTAKELRSVMAVAVQSIQTAARETTAAAQEELKAIREASAASSGVVAAPAAPATATSHQSVETAAAVAGVAQDYHAAALIERRKATASQVDHLVSGYTRHIGVLTELFSAYVSRKQDLLPMASLVLGMQAASLAGVAPPHHYPQQQVVQQQVQQQVQQPQPQAASRSLPSAAPVAATPSPSPQRQISSTPSSVDKRSYSQFSSPYIPPSATNRVVPAAKLHSLQELKEISGVAGGVATAGGGASSSRASSAGAHPTAALTAGDGSFPAVSAATSLSSSSAAQPTGDKRMSIPTLLVKNEESIVVNEVRSGTQIDDSVFTVNPTAPINDLHAQQSPPPAAAAAPVVGNDDGFSYIPPPAMDSAQSTVDAPLGTSVAGMMQQQQQPHQQLSPNHDMQRARESSDFEFEQLTEDFTLNDASRRESMTVDVPTSHALPTMGQQQQLYQPTQVEHPRQLSSTLDPSSIAPPPAHHGLSSPPNVTNTAYHTPEVSQASHISPFSEPLVAPTQYGAQQPPASSIPMIPDANDSFTIADDSFVVGAAKDKRRGSKKASSKPAAKDSDSSLTLSSSSDSLISSATSSDSDNFDDDGSDDSLFSSDDSLNQLSKKNKKKSSEKASKKAKKKEEKAAKSDKKKQWATTDVTEARRSSQAVRDPSDDFFSPTDKKKKYDERERRRSTMAPDIMDLDEGVTAKSEVQRPKLTRRSSFDDDDDDGDEDDLDVRSDISKQSGAFTPSATPINDMLVESLSFAGNNAGYDAQAFSAASSARASPAQSPKKKTTLFDQIKGSASAQPTVATPTTGPTGAAAFGVMPAHDEPAIDLMPISSSPTTSPKLESTKPFTIETTRKVPAKKKGLPMF